MVTEAPVRLTWLKCQACDKNLMKVLPEHEQWVLKRIQIKCKCGAVTGCGDYKV